MLGMLRFRHGPSAGCCAWVADEAMMRIDRIDRIERIERRTGAAAEALAAAGSCAARAAG